MSHSKGHAASDPTSRASRRGKAGFSSNSSMAGTANRVSRNSLTIGGRKKKKKKK